MVRFIRASSSRSARRPAATSGCNLQSDAQRREARGTHLPHPTGNRHRPVLRLRDRREPDCVRLAHVVPRQAAIRRGRLAFGGFRSTRIAALGGRWSITPASSRRTAAPAAFPARPPGAGGRLKVLLVTATATLLLEHYCRAILGQRLAHLTAPIPSRRHGPAGGGSLRRRAVRSGPEAGRRPGLARAPENGLGVPDDHRLGEHRAVAARLRTRRADFVPKLVSRERLLMALRRVARPPEPAGPPDQFLAVRHRGGSTSSRSTTCSTSRARNNTPSWSSPTVQRNFYDKCLGRPGGHPAALLRAHPQILSRAVHDDLPPHRSEGSRYFAELSNGLPAAGGAVALRTHQVPTNLTRPRPG